MCPQDVQGPRFLQLYIFDTDSEVHNRMHVFDSHKKKDLDSGIVQLLM